MLAAARVEGQSTEDMVMKGWQKVELDGFVSIWLWTCRKPTQTQLGSVNGLTRVIK